MSAPAPLPVDFAADVLLLAALDLAALGPVLVLPPRSKAPRRGSGGLKDASTVPEAIRAARARDPFGNIGLRTDRLLVLDVDGEPGRTALAALEAEHGPLPLTATASTGRGEHRYFAGVPGVGQSAGRLGAGLDIKAGPGCFVVTPPSVHSSGKRYSWLVRSPIAPAPAWLIARARGVDDASGEASGEQAARISAEASLVAGAEAVRTATAGARNVTLNEITFRLAQFCGARLLDEHDARARLAGAALAAGLPEREAVRTIDSAFRAGLARPRQPNERAEYAVLPRALWNDSTVGELPSDALLVLFALRSWPTGCSFGLFQLDPTALARVVKLSPQRVGAALRALEAAELLRIDRERGTAFLSRVAFEDPPKNGNAVRRWRKLLERIPDGPLKAEAVAVLRVAAGSWSHFLGAALEKDSSGRWRVARSKQRYSRLFPPGGNP